MTKIGFGEKVLGAIVFVYLLSKFLSVSQILLVALGIVLAHAALTKYRMNLWKRLNIPGPTPTLYLGTGFRGLLEGDLHARMVTDQEQYGKVCGIFLFTVPVFRVSDLNLMRNILVKDFHNFTNRTNLFFDTSDEKAKDRSIFNSMMTILVDDEWRKVRNTITPAFTSGKMKLMVPLLTDCVDLFEEILTEKVKDGLPLNIKDLFSCFTLDVIASVAFGTSVDSQRDPNNPMIAMSKRMNAGFSLKSFPIIFFTFFPYLSAKLYDWFGIRVFFGDVENFYRKLLGNMIESRKHEKNPRMDFLQLMLNAAEENTDAAESGENGKIKPVYGKLTKEEIMSQCFVFLQAGHETTAGTLTMAAHNLAFHPEIQDKCYREIRDAIESEGNDVNYYNVVQNKIPYIDMVIQETLRMYPAAVALDRFCENDYESNGYFIPAKTMVQVAIYGIHHDPEYYPEPEKFIPERFSPEEKSQRDPLLYLPFGYGNRNCIGMRFAMLEMKLVLARLLLKFEFKPCAETERAPLKMRSDGLLRPKNQIKLMMSLREN